MPSNHISARAMHRVWVEGCLPSEQPREALCGACVSDRCKGEPRGEGGEPTCSSRQPREARCGVDEWNSERTLPGSAPAGLSSSQRSAASALLAQKPATASGDSVAPACTPEPSQAVSVCSPADAACACLCLLA